MPIYVGGVTPPALRRAGRLADGWIPLGVGEDELPRYLDQIRGFREEAGRLGGELADLDAYRAKLSTRLQDESFLAKAPEEVVDRERQRLEATEERRSRVEEILSRLGS